MALSPGVKLGPYEIVGALGAGGMGEVYRARDPRLGRDVAVKILPAAVASDPERLARFEQEARATAALNHPNILAVYDIGCVDGVTYVVSELLEGETLRGTLTHGAVATRQAVDYSVQIAHGLAAAHEKGIVHRDLKPENVFVTRDGRVKILDFGLAKLVAPAPFDGAQGRESGHHPGATMMPTTPVSAAGMIVGTVGYMAPEQVRGQTVDHRADIFAFGAILYELLTGARAFVAETPADTISAILKEDPPLLANPARLGNAALHRVVQRCLEKKPERRFHSAHDLAYAIEASAQAESGIRAPVAAVTTGRRPFASPLWIALACVALAAVASSYVAIRHLTEPAPRPPVVRLTPTLPPGTSLAAGPGGRFLFSVSPDGRSVVAALRAPDGVRLWLRPIDAFEFRPLRGTEGITGPPFWSPDGTFVAFQVGQTLKRVAVADSAVETVATFELASVMGSWSAEGILVTGGAFAGGTNFAWIPAGSGRQTPFKPNLATTAGLATANLLSGGRVLYSLIDANRGWSLAIGSIGSTAVRPLGPVAGAVTVADGFLLFLRNTTLVAQRFDEASATLVGDPMNVDDDVMLQLGLGSQGRRGAFATSRRNGTLVYVSGQSADTRLTWVDRDGRPGDAIGTTGSFLSIALSRDGTRVAYGRADADTGRNNVWITDLGRNVSSRFSSVTNMESDAAWSPDGDTIAFTSLRSDGKTIYRKPAAGGSESLVLHLEQNSDGLDDWSRDGRFLLYHVAGEERALPLTGDRTPITVVGGVTRPDEGAFSPDGRLVALNADDTGRTEVYVTPFPPTGERWQVSNSGGAQPRWRSDGRELYYLTLDGAMMAVSVGQGRKPELSAPKKLFQTQLYVRTTTDQYAVAGDGQRFLMMWPESQQQAQLRVVLNWPSLIDRR